MKLHGILAVAIKLTVPTYKTLLAMRKIYQKPKLCKQRAERLETRWKKLKVNAA